MSAAEAGDEWGDHRADGQKHGQYHVLSVPGCMLHAGRLFALASVEIDIAGIVIELHGIRALRVGTAGTRVELPQFRDAGGLARPVVTLPPEIYGPIGDAVLDALVERGLAKRRFTAA